jgi:poly-gamma-glutamate synthesis protein (capsule biosynthesis protein)
MVAGFSVILTACSVNGELSENYRQTIVYLAAPRHKVATLYFVGDIMLDRGVEIRINKEGNGDWTFPFQEIVPFFKPDSQRLIFGNLEGPVSDKGKKIGTIYSFRMDPKAVNGLKYLGFDIVSLANNHIFDYDEAAIKDTFKRLGDSGISYVGAGRNEAEANHPVIKEVNGTKVAYLAYTDLAPKGWLATETRLGVSRFGDGEVIGRIKEARKIADIVVVSYHMGDEYQTESNQKQKDRYRLFIDSGADLVIGHHPHVVQETERYKNGFIAYSLGNFVFDQDFSKETMSGMIVRAVIINNKIARITEQKTAINRNFQPTISFAD